MTSIHRFDIVDVPFLIQLQREFKNGIKQVVWMYDVNCKYSVNLHSRSFNNPYSPLEPMYQQFLKDSTSLLYLVNVWHGNSHRPQCGDKHSIRNTPNTGMVTGEEVETAWVKPNQKQYDVREMDAIRYRASNLAPDATYELCKIETERCLPIASSLLSLCFTYTAVISS